MADYVKWSDELSIGIELIDNQHRRLVRLINGLHTAGQRGDREGVTGVLDALMDYAHYHFEYEEELMACFDYPYLGPHRRVHQLFLRRLTDYHQRHLAGDEVAEALHGMMRRWLVNHIRHEDRDYAIFIRRARNGGGVADRPDELSAEADAEAETQARMAGSVPWLSRLRLGLRRRSA